MSISEYLGISDIFDLKLLCSAYSQIEWGMMRPIIMKWYLTSVNCTIWTNWLKKKQIFVKANYYNLNKILFSDSGGSQCSLWTQTQRVLQEPDV